MIEEIGILTIFVVVTVVCSMAALRGITMPAIMFALFFGSGALIWLEHHNWRWEGWSLLLMAAVLAGAWYQGRRIAKRS